MEKLRVIDSTLGFGTSAYSRAKLSSNQKSDYDTLSIINDKETQNLKSQERYQKFHEWLALHGAKYPAVDYPVAFGHHGELIGLAAKKDIPPQKVFLFIPQKLIINELVCKQDKVCGPIYLKHPEIFRDHFDAEYLLMITFVMHHMLIGEKSFWYPFWQVVNLSDLPMRWGHLEVHEFQDTYLQREISTFREEYYREFDLIFDTFRQNKYDHVWPGVSEGDKNETKKRLEEMFYKCFNTIVTRCFGWGLPKTSLIPFADCINHHNVDSTYEFICEELHRPLLDVTDQSDKYNLDINEFIQDNRDLLELDNPDVRDQEDASYYTKSKMMINISDFYLDEKEEQKSPKKELKMNNGLKKKFAEDDPAADDGHVQLETKLTEDIRSQKLTNRSIHSIKKFIMREQAYETTSDDLLQESTVLHRAQDIWDLDYKSTSDEEDNDSDEEEVAGKQKQYPRLHSEPGGGQKEAEQPKAEPKKKEDEEDVVMKLIDHDRALVCRDLEARLVRIRRQQATLRKFRKQSSVTMEELVQFDESEDYSWWRGINDDRGVYFAMGTKFCSSYKKGDQLFNCYGRRTNRFLLVNYGFCLRQNKYNSLGFKVFVNYTNPPTPPQKKDSEERKANPPQATQQQFQKIIRMKLNRLSLDLLQYLRANLVFTFKFKSQVSKDHITVSTPIDTDFELYCLEQAVILIKSMIDTKYPTTLAYDLKILDQLNGEKNINWEDLDHKEIKELISKKPSQWRYKLAVIHRVNQKEVLANQLKFMQILHMIIRRCQRAITQYETESRSQQQSPLAEDQKQFDSPRKAKVQELSSFDFKRMYLHPVKEAGESAEDEQGLIRNRLVLRYYLLEYVQSQQTLFGYFK